MTEATSVRRRRDMGSSAGTFFNVCQFIIQGEYLYWSGGGDEGIRTLERVTPLLP